MDLGLTTEPVVEKSFDDNNDDDYKCLTLFFKKFITIDSHSYISDLYEKSEKIDKSQDL